MSRRTRVIDPPALWAAPPPRSGLQIDAAFQRREGALRRYLLAAIAGALLAGWAFREGSLGISIALLLPTLLITLLAFLGHRQLSRRRELMCSGVLLEGEVASVEEKPFSRPGFHAWVVTVSYLPSDGVRRTARLIAKPPDPGAPASPGDRLPLLVSPTRAETLAAHLGGVPVGVVEVRKATL